MPVSAERPRLVLTPDAPTKMVSMCMSVVEWEIIVMALMRAADQSILENATCVMTGRKVLRHIAGCIQTTLSGAETKISSPT